VPYIIKLNHSSGPKYVEREREEVNKARILALCRQWLQAPYGQEKGEWGYRDVHRQIMVEELLSAPHGTPFPEDYKFMVFSGRVDCIRHGRNAGPKDSFSTSFDRDWNRMSL